MKLNSSRRMGLLRCWWHEHQETKKKTLQDSPGDSSWSVGLESLKVVLSLSTGSSKGCGRKRANRAKPKKRRGRGKGCQSCDDLSHTLVLGGETKRSLGPFFCILAGFFDTRRLQKL